MLRVLLILLFVPVCSFQQAVTGVDLVVMKAAESQLPAFLDKLQPGQEAAYGLNGEDDLDLAKPGKPFRLLVFNNDFYDNRLDEEKNYVVIKNEWRVPVAIRDSVRSLLTMRGNPGNYTIAGMGDPALAKELVQRKEGLDENDAFYLLYIPRLNAYFFATEHENSFADAKFVPLRSAVHAIPSLAAKQAYAITEVEQIVKGALTTAVPIKQPQPEPVKEKPGKNGGK